MDTNVKIKLKAVNTNKDLECNVTVGYVTKQIKVSQDTLVEFKIHPDKGDTVDIVVDYHSKTIEDYGTDGGHAILIENIEINGISNPQFLNHGTFYPEYPDWEKDQGPLRVHYLGFKGRWILPITIPAYTWIHNVLDLGWHY